MTNPSENSDQSKKKELIDRLVEEIKSATVARDFVRADALRNKMMEVDPMALSDIIKSAEIIENAKAAGVDKDHLRIWDHLYSDLNQEETNCLFYSLIKIVVPPKKIILSHGAYNKRLFFIDKGKVTIIFPRKGKNTVLAQLGPGSLLGEYSFTSISLCSATAVSHSDVTLYYLENSTTDSWDETHPGLYDKITDFCRKQGSLEDIARWKSLEKRNKPRFPASGAVKATLLDKNEQKTSTYFRGDLADISLEGVSFEIKLSKKATARALLARQLQLSLYSPGLDENAVIEVQGKIVKVSFYMQNDYCLHIQFKKPITKAHMHKIVKQ